MKIRKLRISHFGKFHNREIEFADGLNLVEGGNESGKTTVHAFIRAMLFGIDKPRGRAARDDLYTRYQPWDSPGAYQGSMDFEHEGREYRLTRIFYQKEKSCQLTDQVTGRQLPLADGRITSLIPELTQTAYTNTVSVGQMGTKPDESLAEELRNYLANLSTAASGEVDVAGALETLGAKKKALARSLCELDLDRLRETRTSLLETEQKVNSLLEERVRRAEELEKQKKLREDFLGSPEYARAEDYSVIPAEEERLKNLIELREDVTTQDRRIEADIMIKERLEIDLASASERLDAFDRAYESSVNEMHELEDLTRRNVGKTAAVLIVCGLLMVIAVAAMLITSGVATFSAIGANFADAVNASLHTNRGRIVLSAIVAALLVIVGTLIRKRRKKRRYLPRLKELRDFCGDHDAIRTELLNAVELRSAAFRESTARLAEEQRTSGLKLSRFDKELPELVRELTGEDTAELSDDELWELLPSPEELHARYDECLRHRDMVRATVDTYDERIRRAGSELERISWELERAGDVGASIDANRLELADAEEKEKRLRCELEAVNLAIDTITVLSDEIHDTFGTGINGLLSRETERMTAGRYKQARVNRDFDIEVMSGMDYVPVSSLSTGATEQLWLALRSAVAGMFFENVSVPRVLDESFAYSDDERLRSALKTIISEENCQTLMFACSGRERRMLDELGAKYNLILL